jgi:hypothetical protein
MFQFPGFASKPLCIQSLDTWLTPLSIAKAKNSKVSGGFPHSDISGSKPIPGSPKLNAGYHVLHRLLLPRHPPNALFALDLVQKKQDRSALAGDASSLPNQKSYIFSHRARRWFAKQAPVSVLDLEQYRSRGQTPRLRLTRQNQRY